MTDPEETYTTLLRDGLAAESDPATAINRLGILVGVACNLRRQDGLQTAIAWSDTLAARDLSEAHRAQLHYFIGNTWSGLDQLRHQSQELTWVWERVEIEQEVFHLRKAAILGAEASLPVPYRCKIHTNLGNALSKIGRFVEAHEHWSAALVLDPHFAMAIGNRGFGLLHYARSLFDPSHVALFVQTCCRELNQALAGDVEPHAREPLQEALAQAQAWAKRLGLPQESLFREHSLGDSPAEIAYRTWCLKHRLFINPLNDLAPHPLAAADVLHLPSITLPLDQPPSILGYFNQLKQEFVSARYIYYEGITSKDTHFSDRHVGLVNTLDYPAYGLAVERVKAAFRTAYSILDKLAFFLNHYLALGISPRDASFRSFWYQKQKRENGLRHEFTARPNWPLRGLYWLSKDLSEDRPGFREAMSPDAQDMADIRNHLEHRYLKLHEESWATFRDSNDATLGFSMDTLSRSLNRRDFEAKTLRILKLARAALIYTSLAVHVEERERQRHRDPTTVIPKMPVDVWEDEWKR